MFEGERIMFLVANMFISFFRSPSEDITVSSSSTNKDIIFGCFFYLRFNLSDELFKEFFLAGRRADYLPISH